MLRKKLLFARGLLFLCLLGPAPVRLLAQTSNQQSNQKTSLKSALLDLQKTFKVSILFEDKAVEGIMVDKALVNNRQTIEENLDRLLKEHQLSFKKTSNSAYIIMTPEATATTPKVGATTAPPEGERTVTGTIIDEKGEPVIGASVAEKGTSNGVVTDIDGNFSLKVANDPTTQLDISSMGFTNQDLVIGDKENFKVTMVSGEKGLDEVVVVGYGTQKKRDITGAVSSYKAEDLQINSMPQTNVVQSLQGRIPGVMITTGSAGAEADMNVQVRGRNSISASTNPLIVVDGVPFSDNLSEINPNDIESLEVLKDASAAAIYGSRAANGVILITTKKGKSGKPHISYNGYYGVDKLGHLPDMMNGAQFYQTKVDRFGESSLTNTEIEGHATGRSTDWVDLATRTGTRQQHALSVAGGSAQTHYYISGTYNGTRGVALNDKFDRTTIRINMDTKIRPWLTMGTNTQLGSYDRSGLSADFSNAFTMNPLAVPYNADGTLNLTPWAEDAYWHNPLENLNVKNEDITRSVFSNNYIKIDVPFIKGLSYRLNTGYTFRTRDIETYYGADTRDGLQQKGVAKIDNWKYQDWLLENIVDYSRKFGQHQISFTGLYSAQSRTTKNHDFDANGFPTDIMTYYQNNYATTIVATDEYILQRWESQMGRLNYSYKGKYLATATVRRDGYSAFGSDNKFGVFPSLALGWNISEENFMKGITWLDNLKIRASYGKNGNQAISAYATLPQLSAQPYIGNNGETAVGFYPSRIGDPTLSWETTDKYNAGADFSFFKSRLQGSVNYYFSKTYDLLLYKLISPVNGTRSILNNIGEVHNNGLEMTLSSVNVTKKNFSWTTDFNISFYRNKIVNVGLYDKNGKPTDDVANRWFVGQPISVNYSYIVDNIWQEGEETAGSAQPTAQPGDVKVRDVNGDGTITADDRAIIGSAVPSYMAGITNTFRYKGLSLSVFIRTVQGTTKNNELINTYFDGRNAAMNRTWWTAANPINYYPANRDDANPYQAIYFSNFNNSSFVKISDITLKYTFPAALLSKAGIGNLDVFVNAKNVATFTKWKGMDPELDSQTGIPMSRSLIFGLNLGF